MSRPRNAERRPRRKGGALEIAQANGDTKSITALIPVQARARDVTASGVCWRCGVPFARTDFDALRICAGLAREAS